MNTPLGRALDILDDQGVAIWKANVEETEEAGDPAGEYARTIGAWHGLSKGGDVIVRANILSSYYFLYSSQSGCCARCFQGKLVYVNYGRKKDFDALAEAGVDLRGTIALAR